MCSILQIKSESFDVEPTRYKLIDQLNSKGSICLFNDNVNNKQVVLKKFKSIFQSHDVTKAVLRELKILQLLKHESIINLVSILLPPNQSLFNDIYASFDHVDCPLAALIASPQVILLEHIQYFSFQIINAVDFLHTCGVMHCNLNTTTVLVDKDCNLRLSDFTSATIFNLETQVITEENELETTSLDMFSIGCIIAELLLRRPVFPDTTSACQLKKMYYKRKYSITGRQPNALNFPIVSNLNLTVDVGLKPRERKQTCEKIISAADSPARSLMNSLLHWDPVERSSAKDALEHEFICELKDPWDVAHGHRLPRVILVDSEDSVPEPPLPLVPRNLFAMRDSEFLYDLKDECSLNDRREYFKTKLSFPNPGTSHTEMAGSTNDSFSMSTLSKSLIATDSAATTFDRDSRTEYEPTTESII